MQPEQKTVSVGIDLVSLRRFQLLLERHGEWAVSDLFSDIDLSHAKIAATSAIAEEWAYGNFDVRVLAGMFAAKEAAVKALALPPSHGYRFSDISVSGQSGVTIELSEHLQQIARTQAIDGFFGCVSYNREIAMAIIFGVSNE